MTRAKSVAGLISFLLSCAVVQLAGWVLTAPALRSGWYQSIDKPDWTPPPWVFGPVWTVLYISLAVAAWLVWLRSEQGSARLPLSLFFLQLLLNVLWSGLFFALKKPGWALAEIVVLWGTAWLMLIGFGRIQRISGLLGLPYLVWLSFAVALNHAIWRMNI